MHTNTKTDISFQIDNIDFSDGFLTMNVVISDVRDDIAEAEMSVPVEDFGDGEWCALEDDAESVELEVIAIKLEIDAGRLLTALSRTAFEAWEEEGCPTDGSIRPGIGCAVDVPVAADRASAWQASVLVAA